MLKQSAKVGWECAYISGTDRVLLLTGRADRRLHGVSPEICSDCFRERIILALSTGTVITVLRQYSFGAGSPTGRLFYGPSKVELGIKIQK